MLDMTCWRCECYTGGSSVILDVTCWRCECHTGGSSVMVDMTFEMSVSHWGIKCYAGYDMLEM